MVIGLFVVGCSSESKDIDSDISDSSYSSDTVDPSLSSSPSSSVSSDPSQSVSESDSISNGEDFSNFAGVYKNAQGETVTLSADGGTSEDQKGSGLLLDPAGYWSWGIVGKVSDTALYSLRIYPVGVEVSGGIETDTTQARLFQGQNEPMNASEFYYLVK